MTFSVDELMQIQELPENLRTEHCYNDIQHAMMVVLFRYGLSALRGNRMKVANRVIDNISVYLLIHFLNEEEGMAYKTRVGLLERDSLIEHSENHIQFLDFWHKNVFQPHKNGDASREQTIEGLGGFYNTLINHIDKEDRHDYGAGAVAIEQTRIELARIAQANMPMSPYMAGAFQAVKSMDATIAAGLDKQQLNPRALNPVGPLDLIPDVGRILKGSVGSLRDRFAERLGGQKSSADTGARLYIQ